MSASRHQADFSNSLLGAMRFPVCNKKFPVSIAGNFSKEISRFKGFHRTERLPILRLGRRTLKLPHQQFVTFTQTVGYPRK
jgi:hypothetical protein